MVHLGRGVVRPHGLQFVDHFLSGLALGVLLGAAAAGLAELAHAAEDGEVPLVRLAAHRAWVSTAFNRCSLRRGRGPV